VHLTNDCPDDPASQYITQRPSYPYVVSGITFELINTWLQSCESHVTCMEALKTHEDGVLIHGPSRLLYLEDSETATSKVKIIDTNGTERYAALSYCWGKDSSMQLLRSTIDAWKEMLPFDDLPQTIQDAISVTRRLGLKYLWVDRVCIIQDDREDTMKELSAMARIYQRAFLTISAGSASSAIDGFLQPRSKAAEMMRKSRIALEYICPDGSKGTVGLTPAALRKDDSWKADTRAVDARAWTMQEQILSTRTVYFCSNMLSWSCLSSTAGHMHNECDVPGTTPEWSFMMDGTTLLESEWRVMVERYSQRSLSFPGDKLVAISALAEKFGQRFKTKLGIERPRYLAGMWEHELRGSLRWYLDPKPGPVKRPSDYRAPSWSWASVDSVITMYGDRGLAGSTFEILACSVEQFSTSAPYNSVLSGSLTLKGRFREDIWDRRTQKLLRAMGRDYKSDDAPDGFVDALETDLLEDEDGTVPVFCFEMGQNPPKPSQQHGNPFGLILVKESSVAERYRRVGYFELELFVSTGNFIDFSFEGCKKEIVTII
jgi:hypothetical protein